MLVQNKKHTSSKCVDNWTFHLNSAFASDDESEKDTEHGLDSTLDIVRIAHANYKYMSEQLEYVRSSLCVDSLDLQSDVVRAVLEPHMMKAREKRLEVMIEYEPHMTLIRHSMHDLQSQTYIPFDISLYKIREVFNECLFHDKYYDLEQFHTHFSNDMGNRKSRQEKLSVFTPLLDNDRRSEFHDLYEEFVLSVILEDAAANAHPSVTSFYYQSFPCVRCVRPQEFSIGIHCDMAYGFNAANVNYYIPLTRIYDTNSLHVESAVGEEDWHTVTTEYGSLFRFAGAVNAHFTVMNSSEITRFSLDFRVIPSNCFNICKDRYSNEAGYYVQATRDESGKFRRVGKRPEVDARNGFPFTDASKRKS